VSFTTGYSLVLYRLMVGNNSDIVNEWDKVKTCGKETKFTITFAYISTNKLL